MDRKDRCCNGFKKEKLEREKWWAWMYKKVVVSSFKKRICKVVVSSELLVRWLLSAWISEDVVAYLWGVVMMKSNELDLEALILEEIWWPSSLYKSKVMDGGFAVRPLSGNDEVGHLRSLFSVKFLCLTCTWSSEEDLRLPGHVVVVVTKEITIKQREKPALSCFLQRTNSLMLSLCAVWFSQACCYEEKGWSVPAPQRSYIIAGTPTNQGLSLSVCVCSRSQSPQHTVGWWSKVTFVQLFTLSHEAFLFLEFTNESNGLYHNTQNLFFGVCFSFVSLSVFLFSISVLLVSLWELWFVTPLVSVSPEEILKSVTDSSRFATSMNNCSTPRRALSVSAIEAIYWPWDKERNAERPELVMAEVS